MPRNKRSLKSTKGDCPPPLFAHVAHHIKRASDGGSEGMASREPSNLKLRNGS